MCFVVILTAIPYTLHVIRTIGKKISNLDSPITSLAFISNYYNRADNVIDMETISKGDNEIKSLIESYLLQND